MRLWHYELLPYLPKSQLIAQWRELNSIFKKQDNHILINYVYEYQKMSLLLYTQYVIVDMTRREYKIKNLDNYKNYFKGLTLNANDLREQINPFPDHHTDRYLMQCYANLQEKYDRGQKDFDEETFNRLTKFVLQLQKENKVNEIK